VRFDAKLEVPVIFHMIVLGIKIADISRYYKPLELANVDKIFDVTTSPPVFDSLY
jgi:hypothetical protein